MIIQHLVSTHDKNDHNEINYIQVFTTLNRKYVKREEKWTKLSRK